MTTPNHNDFAAALKERNEFLGRTSRILGLAQQATDGCPFEGFKAAAGTLLRRLARNEKKTLMTTCRCRCNDWNKIRLVVPVNAQRVDRSTELQRLVSNTVFDGTVILDMTDENLSETQISDWNNLLPGLHSNGCVSNSIFHLKTCRVYRNTLLSNTHVGQNSILINCGKVSADTNSYGQLSISVGAETGGGRKLQLTSEHTMVDVCQQLQATEAPTMPSDDHRGFSLNVLSRGCIVRDTPTIQNVYLHDYASIQAATSVKNVTMFSHASIGNSSTVSDTLMQWNTTISGNSTVAEAMLMELAHCGPSSIVVSSVLGPDVHVSAGEIHASVVGPNTNAHHQSLVISVLWPLGRGNVGYGSNLGSNHTGRLPDQETASGEGVFWGLSTVIKFPVDLTFSPYTIVAAGTNLPPQRVCMPFSLIVELPSGNEIIPGWVLQSSPYTLARSEKKFATRRKAKRHDFYTGWKILRPETIEMCRWARKALEASGKAQGVGSCKLTPRARTAGVKTYTTCIQRYALQGLLSWIQRTSGNGLDVNALQAEMSAETAPQAAFEVNPLENVEWPCAPWDTTVDEWSYQRKLLLEEFPIGTDISDWVVGVLRKLVQLESDFAKRVHKSKSRDDTRGAQTIPGYAPSHIAAKDDSTIADVQQAAASVDAAVSKYLAIMPKETRSRL